MCTNCLKLKKTNNNQSNSTKTKRDNPFWRSAKQEPAFAGNLTTTTKSNDSTKNTRLPVALLATAIIKLSADGRVTPGARALCDTGAQVNLITQRCIQQLGLTIQSSNVKVTGLGGHGTNSTKGMIVAKLCHREGETITDDINFMVVPQIATTLPSARIHTP